MTALAADCAEVARFVQALFPHADKGAFVSLRTFEHERGRPPVEIRAVRINGGGLGPIVAQATGAATRAARHPKPAGFAPIVCTFKDGGKADEANVRNGVALFVDLDESDSRAGRERLEGLLGPASAKGDLAGVLMPVTSRYDAPLMVSRGHASLSYLHEAASYMEQLAKEVAILHFGDHDPSGQDAADKIEATLREFAPGIEIAFHRCAVTPEQIEAWRPPRRPTNAPESRAKTSTGGESVELDAIDPNGLRELCEEWIEAFIPDDWLDDLRVAEQSERDFLRYWADALAGREP